MNTIYFEAKGEKLLERVGMPKAEFARRMGIQRQNVKALFKSKDLRVIQKAADVIGVPWIFLVGDTEEPDICQLPMTTEEECLDFARQYSGEYDVPEDCCNGDPFKIAPEDIPTGDSVENRRKRQEIISQFYHYWKENNPEHRKYNDDLQDYIYVNHTSLVETAGRASLTYLSTLAVLQLDAILRYAKKTFEDTPKVATKQQRPFEKMLGMDYSCPGIGDVRLMVGVRRQDRMKVQYCITALTPLMRFKKKKQGSLK